MLVPLLAVVLVVVPSLLLAGFVVAEMVPEVVDLLAVGDTLSAALTGAAAVALALIVATGGVVAPLLHIPQLRRWLPQPVSAAAPGPAAAPRAGEPGRDRRLRRTAVTSSEPIMGVKLADVRWDDPAAEPRFAGTRAGTAYDREDVARCGGRVVERLCLDQAADHRCGFYALPDGEALLAELTGAARAEVDEARGWPGVLDACEPTTYVVSVALHGDVIAYDAAVRGQRQTITAIRMPPACARAGCDEAVDAVAAVGRPLGLCTRHATSPDVADRTVSTSEFARRFDIALWPTAVMGRPAPPQPPRASSAAPRSTVTTMADDPAASAPVEHREERVEGWLVGRLDADGRLLTEAHQLTAETWAREPVVATRAACAPAPGQALARVRLGGSVVVRHESVASHDVQIWDLYLPDRCQLDGCQHAAELIDRDGSLAVTRCGAHASEAARPPAEQGAEHGMAIRLAPLPA